MNLSSMKLDQKAALDAANAMVTAAEQSGRGLSVTETETYNTSMAKFRSLSATIKAREEQNTITSVWSGGRPGFDAPTGPGAKAVSANPIRLAETRNPEYAHALHAFLKSGGRTATPELAAGADDLGGFRIPGSEYFTLQRNANGTISAAMYEGTNGGSDGAGGYAVSIPTVQQVVPLAMPDMGIFDASTVIPTNTDCKIPQQASFGTSAIKAESTGTVATFGGTDPTLQQTELSAHMVGGLRVVSWELLQDVEMWQAFIVEDLIRGTRILESALLATGNGTTQPLGVFGNTGTGTGTPYALTGAATDSALLLDSLFDITGSLKAAYQPNASFIMTRATCLAIRRAQMQANLFVPIVTVGADGTTFILDRPVYFDANAPALPAATTAGVQSILYGDFKAGNLIGVRGGAGINVKILDQPWAAQGQLGILAYRRLDSAIRQSEAIQAISFSFSHS